MRGGEGLDGRTDEQAQAQFMTILSFDLQM